MLDCRNFYSKYLGISSPFPHQEQVWDLMFKNHSPLLIRAPTGSGKTESILAPFLAQFLENNFTIAPRLIYVLPMRVLVNNLAERIRNYTKKISESITVKVQHGDISDSPFFIADIVVTTLDQFLYGFARTSLQVGRHIDVPAGSIASSLVVFDEAHMYRDEFTFSVMRALMEIMHTTRIPFVVMTATMPEKLEKSLFEYIQVPPEHRVLGSMPFNNGSLKINLMSHPLFTEDRVYLDDETLNAIAQHRTLVIVNQVARAQKIYKEIKTHLELDDEQIVLLHSRFTNKDRHEHENRALQIIPNKSMLQTSKTARPAVVVSTQVLEAGIDFSAELLITELAPADALIQRAGRCARYAGQSGSMIVFPVAEGGHLPYEEKHLSKTLNWLKGHSEFNIRDFTQVCSFVDATLDYQAADYEARDTLIDLYECVLYADTVPSNIQVRRGKPVTLVVFDISEEKDGLDRIKKEFKENSEQFNENTISVDIGIAYALYNQGHLKLKINRKYDENGRTTELVIEELNKKKERNKRPEEVIVPFGVYILDKRLYNEQLGVLNEPDASSYIV